MKPFGLQLAFRRVLVTGGGSGIGRGVALALAGCGATVFVAGRRLSMLEQTRELARGLPGRIIPIKADVRSPEQVDAAFAIVEADGGPMQALVHCAAEVGYQPAEGLSPDAFEEVVRSVLLGTYNAVHRWASPLLGAREPGTAIAVTSCVATQGTPGAVHSSSAKAGVEAMFRTLAREWGPHRLRLNILGPGFIAVERTESLYRNRDAIQPVVDQIALGEIGETSDAVNPIMFLLSEGARYVTGEVLVVDGGFRLTPNVLPKWKYETSAPESAQGPGSTDFVR